MKYFQIEHFTEILMKIPRTKNTYLSLYLISHLLFLLYSFIFGIWYFMLSLLIGLIVFNLAAELYMHRTVSHRHFHFSNFTNKIFCALFSMCNFGSLASNCAIHINHHKFSDTEKDPHNFRNIGVLNTILKNWKKEHLPSSKLVLTFLKDENVKNQHYHHMKYAIVSTILFPFIPVASFWLINLLFIVAHLGTDKESRFMNLDLLYPLMWGAEKHRDHHLDISKKKMHNLDLIYYTGRVLDTSV